MKDVITEYEALQKKMSHVGADSVGQAMDHLHYAFFHPLVHWTSFLLCKTGLHVVKTALPTSRTASQ